MLAPTVGVEVTGRLVRVGLVGTAGAVVVGAFVSTGTEVFESTGADAFVSTGAGDATGASVVTG
jgi:hypothetical protein